MDQTAAVTLRELLEVGAHFGHQRSRWNPAMRPYIFGLRGGVYVIDLQKTVVLLQDAINFVRDLTAQGKIVLFEERAGIDEAEFAALYRQTVGMGVA